MANITDKFGKASIDIDYAIATTVKTTRNPGVAVLEAFDLSKFSDDTPVFFVTYKKTTDPVTDITSVTNLVSWKGLVNTGANTLTNLELAPGYADTGNATGDFIECIPTSHWTNSLIGGILTHTNPDGTLKNNSVSSSQITDGSVVTSKINDNAVTTAKIADGSVIPAKLGLTKTTDANGWTTIDLGVMKIYTKNSQWTGNSNIPFNDIITLSNENLPSSMELIPENAIINFGSWSNDRSLVPNMSANIGSYYIQRNVFNVYSAQLTLTGAKWYITIIVPTT